MAIIPIPNSPHKSHLRPLPSSHVPSPSPPHPTMLFLVPTPSACTNCGLGQKMFAFKSCPPPVITAVIPPQQLSTGNDLSPAQFVSCQFELDKLRSTYPVKTDKSVCGGIGGSKTSDRPNCKVDDRPKTACLAGLSE